MTAHKEIAFEEEICEHLGSHGWIYVEGDASSYDRARALFPENVSRLFHAAGDRGRLHS